MYWSAWGDLANGVKLWSTDVSPASSFCLPALFFSRSLRSSQAVFPWFQPRLTPPTLLLKQITGKWVVLARGVLSLKYGCVWSAGRRHSQRRGYMFRYEQDQSFCCRYHYQFVMSAKAQLNSSAQDYCPRVIACFSVSLTAFSPKAPYAVWPEICWRGTMGFGCLALARFEVMNLVNSALTQPPAHHKAYLSTHADF